MSEKMTKIVTEDEKNRLRSALLSGVVAVSFIKKDGTPRFMNCTLLESKIPSEQAPKGTGKAKSEDSLAVFDLENNGWRSFRYDSITEVDFRS